jgi:hypothetical protein
MRAALIGPLLFRDYSITGSPIFAQRPFFQAHLRLLRSSMSLLHKSASIFSRRLPKVVGPHLHSVVDYSFAALFFVAGAAFWRRHKNASIGALLCGAGVMLNTMLTDHPGGVVRAISREAHGKIDLGLAGLTAAIPGLMGFADDPPARFFETSAIAETLAAGFTDFHDSEAQDDDQSWLENNAA